MLETKKVVSAACALLVLGLLAGPHLTSAQADTTMWEVTITNLTAKQALSPPIIVTHASAAHAWQVGQVASEGVELVAEEGMNDKLAAEVRSVATDMAMATSPLMPGNSVTLKVMAHDGDVLSAATMLVQTNDGLTGLDNMPLADGSRETMAYDAGTEENTELAAHVPGPPFNGHNAGTPTSPRQPISMHPGISGTADVGTDFNWSGPVARFAVRSLGSMPGGMPNTGATDTAPLVLLALLAGVLSLAGLGLRRVIVTNR